MDHTVHSGRRCGGRCESGGVPTSLATLSAKELDSARVVAGECLGVQRRGRLVGLNQARDGRVVVLVYPPSDVARPGQQRRCLESRACQGLKRMASSAGTGTAHRSSLNHSRHAVTCTSLHARTEFRIPRILRQTTPRKGLAWLITGRPCLPVLVPVLNTFTCTVLDLVLVAVPVHVLYSCTRYRMYLTSGFPSPLVT